MGVAGPSLGVEFLLEGDELVIGRSSENPVSIADSSVSRKHALVRRTESGWALSDLGSGNGTLLNDEPVVDETELAEGDVITMGDTQLQFANELAAPGGPVSADTQDTEDVGRAEELAPARSSRPPVRTARSGMAMERASPRGRPVRARGRGVEDARAARQGKRKVLITIGGALVVILALLVGWKAVDGRRRQDAQRTEAAQRAHRDEMGEQFKAAKALVKQGKWRAAKAKLEEIQAADPDYEPQQLLKYIENATREIPNEGTLEVAREALEANQLGAAAEALRKVVETPQSEIPVRLVRETLDARFTEKLSEARSLATTRDLAAANRLKTLTEDLLRVHPDDRDANMLKTQAIELIRVITTPTAVVSTPETPWVEVQQRFRTGDATGALSLAGSCSARQARCRELESQIKDWGTKSKQVEGLSETELIALYELDRRISGGSSSEQSGPIKTQLVSKLFVKASQAKTTGNWSRATEYARIVLKAAPDHHGAQSLVQEARNQAKDVYLRGYQLMETNPEEAVRLFKDVMTMTPGDDEYHQKAKARMAELQGK